MRKIKIGILLTFILILAILIGIGITQKVEKDYFILLKGLKERGDNYFSCQKYWEAKEHYERALYYASKIHLYAPSKKRVLVKKIKERLSDPIFQKVNSGLIFIEGKWVPKEEYEETSKLKKEIKVKVKKLLIEAKELFIKEDYENALSNYRESLSLIEKYNLKEPFNKKEIERVIFKTEQAKFAAYRKKIKGKIQELKRKGDENFKIFSWDEALQYYREAFKLAERHDFVDTKVIAELKSTISQAEKNKQLAEMQAQKDRELAEIEDLIKYAKRAEKKENYREAETVYNDALTIIKNSRFKNHKEFLRRKKEITFALNSDEIVKGAKGYIKYKGKWLTPKKYENTRLKEGYIRYNGEWVLTSNIMDILKQESYNKALDIIAESYNIPVNRNVDEIRLYSGSVEKKVDVSENTKVVSFNWELNIKLPRSSYECHAVLDFRKSTGEWLVQNIECCRIFEGLPLGDVL